MKLMLPYGKELLPFQIPQNRLQGVLVSELHHYSTCKSQLELVEEALANPVDSLPLHQLAKDKKNVIFICSDHTRPVPSKLIVPLMLKEIRKGNPNAHVTILIATGCHREMEKQEIINKFGQEIADNETIIMHNCDTAEFVKIGILPSGGECLINRLVIEADLVVAEGFIEPHFFAGYSGGRKSILPGVASRVTVLGNHCSEFIADSHARTGVLENNPIHTDMVWAARKANLAFIVNVVINEKKEAIFAVAGDAIAAHEEGCKFLSSLCRVDAKPADIVVSTNGGYPLDQNIYQSVKGMTAAEATVKPGGVIIMLSKSEDGHGGEDFYHQMADEPNIEKTLQLFLNRNRNETVPDQWQTQIFIRVLQKAKVIFISDAPDDMVRNLHLIPAHSIEEAMKMAEEILDNTEASVTVIPDGVSVMVIEQGGQDKP